MIIREDHFICSGGLGFKALLKMRIPTSITTVSHLTFETINSGLVGTLRGCCTDGTHVFVVTGAPAVQRYSCVDLSFIDQVTNFNGADSFHNPRGITLYGTWIYVADQWTSSVNRIIRFLKADFSYVDEIDMDSTPAQALDNNGIHLYVSTKGIPPA
jgi:hypothetical protein